MSINLIVVAAIALIVMVILIAIFAGKMGDFSGKGENCINKGGTCQNKNAEVRCEGQGEIRIPANDCKTCCITVGDT